MDGFNVSILLGRTMEPKHEWRDFDFMYYHSKGRMFKKLICKNCGARARKFGSDIEIEARSLDKKTMRNCSK